MKVEVAPLGGAWIEILCKLDKALIAKVAPLGGAWIEITLETTLLISTLGRTPRGCVDRNLLLFTPNSKGSSVAPLGGAWIEISASNSPCGRITVAPLWSAWIEIRIAC